MNSKVILKLENISFEIKKTNQQKILQDINLEIYHSEIFGITGESGSGKTTLAKIIAGLEFPSSGKKLFNGKEFSGIHSEHKIQFLFQNYVETHNPLQKINAAFNEILRLKKSDKSDFFKYKKEILNLVNLSDDVLSLFPSQLSGGQLQRLALAKLLLLQPEFLILDEPFASQDVVSVVNLIKIFQHINQKLKTTFLCISHEIPYLLKFCNRIGVMKNGELMNIISIERDKNKLKIDGNINDYTKFLFKSFGIEI
ncbi:MAG: ATP-binding cassette domain-containing protein [Candidatus Anstonellales archaeon]